MSEQPDNYEMVSIYQLNPDDQEKLLLSQRECGASKGFEITLSTSHSNPDGCLNDTVLEVPCSHLAINQIVSIALTAYTAKKRITELSDKRSAGA